MGKPSAPKPPDPRETSAAQTGTNVATAIANAYLQNPDEVTPFGSRSYTLSDENAYTYTDPYTNQEYTIPKVMVDQQLTAEGQQLLDSNVATQLNLAGIGEQQSGFLKDYLSDPFSYDPGQHESWALGLYDQLNAPREGQREEAMRTRLVNQGIAPGSEAYAREMRDLYGGQDDARNKFLLDSYRTGMDTALTNRNQPLREITSLLSGTQPQQPTFSGANIPGIPTTDNAGLIGQDYQNRLGAWQQKNAQRGSLLGGLFDLGAAGITGGLFG